MTMEQCYYLDMWKRLYFLLVLFIVLCDKCNAQDTLRHVQIVFRHGDKIPEREIPTYPLLDTAWAPYEPESLTTLGMGQLRNLGETLRKRYASFINSTYVTNEIFVRSTDTDRTLMSAASLLAGLYPPQGFQVWDPSIAWQPIPIHTQPLDRDFDILTVAACPVWDEQYQAAIQSEYSVKLYEDNKAMIDYIVDKAGWPATEPWQKTLAAMFTFEPLYGMLNRNVSWPEWVTPDIYLFLEQFFPNDYHYRFDYPNQLHLKVGPFLNTIITTFEAIINNSTDVGVKMRLYSSHDRMLIGTLKALGVWNGQGPQYGSAIFFELHQTSPDYSYTIRMMYKNDTVLNPGADPMILHIPGCPTIDCPIDIFRTVIQPHVYTGTFEDWEEECNKTPGFDLLTVTVLSILAVLLVFIITLFAIHKAKPTKYEQL